MARTSTNDLKARHLRGELNSAEERMLAQRALEDEGLFDDLTASALVKRGLGGNPIQDPPGRRHDWAWFAIPAIAALIVVAFFTSNPRRSPVEPASPSIAVAPKPAAPTAGNGEPILLAADWELGRTAEAFRGFGSTDRAPHQEGSILSIDGQTATVNLGSLDGLLKGATLSLKAGGRLTVTTVFRDKARADAPTGVTAQTGDSVRSDNGVYFAALIERIDSLTHTGTDSEALSVATETLRWANNAGFAPGAKRAVWERLGALSYRGKQFGEAEKYYMAAAEVLDAAPAAADRERAFVWNNAGVAAENAGDSAVDRYTNAQRFAASLNASDQTAIKTNLDRVRSKSQ